MIQVSAPQQPAVVEIAVQNATGGSYMLQSTYYRNNQIQFETTRAVAWDEDPQEALSMLPSVQELTVAKVLSHTPLKCCR